MLYRCQHLMILLSSGAYGAGEDGLAALADDIEYVCTLWRVGTSKGKVTAGVMHANSDRPLQHCSRAVDVIAD